MGYLTVITATRDCARLADYAACGVAVATAHDTELASATVRTELLAPEPDWWREQTQRDLAKHFGREYKARKIKVVRDLEDSDIEVLALLRAHDQMQLPEIRAGCRCCYTSVHNALQRLLGRGLIEFVEYRTKRGTNRSPVYRAVEANDESDSQS